MEYEHIKHLEQERDEAKAQLAEANRKLKLIYALVEGSADGTVDATDYEHLCNRIVGIITP